MRVRDQGWRGQGVSVRGQGETGRFGACSKPGGLESGLGLWGLGAQGVGRRVQVAACMVSGVGCMLGQTSVSAGPAELSRISRSPLLGSQPWVAHAISYACLNDFSKAPQGGGTAASSIMSTLLQ